MLEEPTKTPAYASLLTSQCIQNQNENLRYVRKQGRKKWKRDANYHRRSLSETPMFCFKAIFGGNLSTRKFKNQAVELFIKCAALNRIIQIAKPDSYAVKA